MKLKQGAQGVPTRRIGFGTGEPDLLIKARVHDRILIWNFRQTNIKQDVGRVEVIVSQNMEVRYDIGFMTLCR